MREVRIGRWDRGFPRIRADQVSPRLVLAIVKNSVSSIISVSGRGLSSGDTIIIHQ